MVYYRSSVTLLHYVSSLTMSSLTVCPIGALWQLPGRWLFSWRREILTVKDKETERDGVQRRPSCQTVATPYPSYSQCAQQTPFPFLSLQLYCNLRTHTCFYWLHHTSWPLLANEKNFSPCCHTVVLPWVHTSLQKLDDWVTAALSFYLLYQLVCMLDCLSVSLAVGQLAATTVCVSLLFVS